MKTDLLFFLYGAYIGIVKPPGYIFHQLWFSIERYKNQRVSINAPPHSESGTLSIL